MFAVGWIARLLGLLFVAQLHEPGAWTWHEIVRQRQTKRTGSAVSQTSGAARSD